MEGKSVVDEQKECKIYSVTEKKQSNDTGSSHDERKKIVQMRALLEKQDPTSKVSQTHTHTHTSVLCC